MSVTVDFFFNDHRTLGELGAEVNRALGCSLEPYQGDPGDLYCSFLGMDFSLSETGDRYTNDGEIDFESFRFELEFRTSAGNWNRPIQLISMFTCIHILNNYLDLAGVFVYDMQILPARYENREIPEHGERLFDVVSGTPFLDAPGHLATILGRLPDATRQAILDR